jgi:hypothetical protein
VGSHPWQTILTGKDIRFPEEGLAIPSEIRVFFCQYFLYCRPARPKKIHKKDEAKKFYQDHCP